MFNLMIGFKHSQNNIMLRFNDEEKSEAARLNIISRRKEAVSSPGVTVSLKDDIRQKLDCFADDILWVLEGYEAPRNMALAGGMVQQ